MISTLDPLRFLPYLSLGVLVSLYDWRRKKVPNWVSLPLFLAGLLAHFPGEPAQWAGMGLLGYAWQKGWAGGGDVKLWTAGLWLSPPGKGMAGFVVLLLSITLTAGLQIMVRALAGRQVVGVRGPAAWRALPLFFWLGL